MTCWYLSKLNSNKYTLNWNRLAQEKQWNPLLKCFNQEALRFGIELTCDFPSQNKKIQGDKDELTKLPTKHNRTKINASNGKLTLQRNKVHRESAYKKIW